MGSRGGLRRVVQSVLGGQLADLFDAELGQLVGDNERPLLLDVGLGEDDVDLLEIATGSLNVEEPSEDEGDKVEQSEEEVETPRTPGREDRRKHDNSEVGNPVGAGGGSVGHGTGTEGVDLGRVDPGERQDGEGEEDNVDVDTDGCTIGVHLAGPDQAGHGDDETETLAHETNEVQLAAADLLNHEERGDGGESIDGGEDAAHDHR